jgi:two-component system response regulator AtoC
LRAYRWPGNVRELRNIIERATFLCEAEIDVAHLPGDRMVRPEVAGASRAADVPDEVPTVVNADASEREAIEQALARTSGNQTKAAKLLGVSRRTLSNRLNRHGLARPRKGG